LKGMGQGILEDANQNLEGVRRYGKKKKPTFWTEKSSVNEMKNEPFSDWRGEFLTGGQDGNSRV